MQLLLDEINNATKEEDHARQELAEAIGLIKSKMDSRKLMSQQALQRDDPITRRLLIDAKIKMEMAQKNIELTSAMRRKYTTLLNTYRGGIAVKQNLIRMKSVDRKLAQFGIDIDAVAEIAQESTDMAEDAIQDAQEIVRELRDSSGRFMNQLDQDEDKELEASLGVQEDASLEEIANAIMSSSSSSSAKDKRQQAQKPVSIAIPNQNPKVPQLPARNAIPLNPPPSVEAERVGVVPEGESVRAQVVVL